MAETENNGNGRTWKTAEFQGYMKGKIEDICADMADVKTRLADLDKRITNIHIKVAGIGGAVSLVVTLVIILVKELIAR